ncbi:MAG TPA: hypothetical protein VND64_35145 [Pirellulales bacterium]|nr:hypothetical protein [Pirellulales bacterium]
MFRKTVSAIQRGKGLDPRIGPDDVSAFKKLASPLNRGSKSVFIDDTEITSQYIANADKILNTSLAQEGTVSGSLERVNVHDRYGFILFPPIEGYEISCLFPEEMLDQVRLAIKHNVTVNGLMHYYADSPFPKVVRVVSMEIHPNDDDLPTLEELRGMAPGCTGGLTAVEFTRAVRDD